jgi:hypothetical protein
MRPPAGRPTSTLSRTGRHGSPVRRRRGRAPRYQDHGQPLVKGGIDRGAVRGDSHCCAGAGRERIEDDLVATQGHVMTVDTLFRTLAVEATVQHLDLRLGNLPKLGS